MTTAWTVAFATLFVLTGCLAIIVLGLLRKAVVALEQAQRDSGHQHGAAEIDELANSPSFDIVGITVPAPPGYEWSQLGDSTVVFLEADCEGCQLLAVDATAKRKRAKASRQSLVFVIDEPREALGHLPPETVSVIDDGQFLQRSWNVKSSPVAYYVTASGFVVGASHPHSLQDVLDLKSRVASAQLVQDGQI